MTEPAQGIHTLRTRKLGKRPPQPGRRALMLRDVLTGTLPEHPPTVDYLLGIKFGMYGNDQFGDCITPETRVLTAALEWVRAGSLAVGDRLLGFDEEPSMRGGRKYREAVVECVDVVRRPCYELEFDDGTMVRSSAGHRWLTQSTTQGELGCQRWAETQNLKLGPLRQSRIVKPLDVWETDRSWEAGYLAGAFDGEGSYEAAQRRINFGQTANPMLDEFELALKACGFDFTHHVDARSQRLRTDGSSRKDMHRFAVTGSNMLRLMGSVRPSRLLPKLDVNDLGRLNGGTVRLVGKNFIGEQDVVMLDTSARTYIAEGLASHNCGPTSIANLRRLITYDLTGVIQAPSLTDVYDLYSRSTTPPFDPHTGENDNGVYLQEMLEQVHSGGIGGIRCVAFAKIDVRDHETLRAATAIFGAVLYGVDLQTTQQRQTDAGTWDYVPSNEWGGHAVPGGQYDADSLRIVTWAQLVDMTDSFVTHQADEAWVVIWPEHFGSKAFLQGVDVKRLAAAYDFLTGVPLPVPGTPVPPTPEPVSPSSFPVELDPDVAAHVARLAAHRGVTSSAWVNDRLRRYFA